jgi:hypothetical protein
MFLPQKLHFCDNPAELTVGCKKPPHDCAEWLPGAVPPFGDIGYASLQIYVTLEPHADAQ